MILFYIGLFFTSFFVAFSGAVMPGPLLTATISEAARKGFKAGPLFIIGHSILELVLLVLLVLGFSAFITNEWITFTISIFGSLIMLWMALDMFRSLPRLSLQNPEAAKQKKNLIFTGAIVSLANPYWTIWWATIGLGYILQSQKKGFLGIGLFYFGHILGDFVWYSFIAFVVSSGKKFFNDMKYRILIAACAGLLIFFAILFIWNGLKFLVKFI